MVAGGALESDVAALSDRHASRTEPLAQELATFREWSMPTVRYRPASNQEIDPSPPTETILFTVPKGQAGDELVSLVQNKTLVLTPRFCVREKTAFFATCKRIPRSPEYCPNGFWKPNRSTKRLVPRDSLQRYFLSFSMPDLFLWTDPLWRNVAASVPYHA